MPSTYFLWITLTNLLGVSLAQVLSDSVISSVEDRLAEGAKQSWELGTRSQALLELNVPNFSVFSSNDLPPPTTVPSSSESAISPVFSIAGSVASKLNLTNPNVPQPLVSESSAADPASIGVAVLLANWTGQSGPNYGIAATNQLNYLLFKAPKTSDGAISHRADQVQLWSDFIYMVPPFLAYYGVLSGNKTIVAESYNQIKLYRNYLRDSSSSLWRHIVLGSFNDSGHWSTGNAWAAAGMARVLATIQHSDLSDSFKDEQSDLASWVKEIHTGMYANLDKTNIFTNYADQPISSSGMFYDASSTALLAASVYRISLIAGDHTYIPRAENSRKALSASNDTGMVHFTSDGWLRPVVNPDNIGKQGSESPEGQAFVLEMHAAWKDWVADGSKGSGAIRLVSHWQWIGIIIGLLLA